MNSTFKRVCNSRMVSSRNHILHQLLRCLSLHEHLSLGMLKKYGIAVPSFHVAQSLDDVRKCANDLHAKTGIRDVVVKAQVLSGSRSKGLWDSGLHGGVKTVFTADEAVGVASRMLGHRIFTNQTGSRGLPCDKVMITERKYYRREFYLAIVLDRILGAPVVVVSNKGGVNMQDLAKDQPEIIHKIPIDVSMGMSHEEAERIASLIHMNGSILQTTADIIERLYKLFVENDATFLEINPLVEDVNNQVFSMDCHMRFDDNAAFRHKDLFELRDWSQKGTREAIAGKYGVKYIPMDGNIGVLVNGAGLGMATMDMIQMSGGSPANFLDVGGGATSFQLIEGFRLIVADPKVKAILVNIFGGILRCDFIAKGIIDAAQQVEVKIPIVVRLQGTHVDDAKTLIANSDLKILPCDDFDEAAAMAVRLSRIMEIARQAAVDVSFEIPL